MDDADRRDDDADRRGDAEADATANGGDETDWSDDATWGGDADDASGPGEPTPGVGASEPGRGSDEYGAWDHAKLIGTGLGLVVVAFVLGLVAIFLIQVVLVSAGVELTDTTLLFVSLIGIQGIGFPVTAFGYLSYIDRDITEFVPVEWPTLKEIGLSVGAAIGALILVFLVAIVVVSLVETEPAQNTGSQTVWENPGIVPYLIPFVFLLNGPGEELLFRGVLQGRFRETYGPAVAIVLATLMFAPAHIVSLSGSIQAAALTISFLTVSSLVFGAVYEYTNNFVVPALVHSIYNSILFGSIYLVSRYGPETTETAGLIAF